MEYIEAEMKEKNIYELLPQDKFDNKNIEKLKMLEDKEIKLLIPELLEWLQDYNWPVADDVLQVLLQRENLVVPCVKEILEGSVDVSWFIWLMAVSYTHLALGLEPYKHNVMNEKPRPMNESILTKGFLARVGVEGTVIGLITLGAFMPVSYTHLFLYFRLFSREKSRL